MLVRWSGESVDNEKRRAGRRRGAVRFRAVGNLIAHSGCETKAAAVAQLGVEPMPGSPEEFAKFFRDDVASTVALAKAAKIQAQ